ncbi:hypothetical protein LX36DRAFT_325946 [Colletotrichum falcatum]|nr:hypothetical protein LX36DRAFT_325946 [Colletotrichum falcatum]
MTSGEPLAIASCLSICGGDVYPSLPDSFRLLCLHYCNSIVISHRKAIQHPIDKSDHVVEEEHQSTGGDTEPQSYIQKMSKEVDSHYSIVVDGPKNRNQKACHNSPSCKTSAVLMEKKTKTTLA